MQATTNSLDALERVLLDRATFGSTEDARSEMTALGTAAWLRQQLAPASLNDAALDARLAAFPWLGESAASLRQNYGGGGWRLSEDSKAIRLLRAQLSERQLFERVVDLWNDHFNVPFTAQDANYLRPVYERDVIRQHAFGTFPELLTAVATSGAMAAYLDQDSNVAGQPNENFARELLELHTLGEGNGYSEVDVREVARCFTGWGYVRHWQAGEFGTFRFDAAQHDFGPKRVLGRQIPGGGGVDDGHLVLQLLGRDPRTARFVAQKLVGWFLGPEAAAGALGFGGVSLVDRVTAVYLRTGGKITDLLRAVLSDAALASVRPWRRRKVKQPFHFAVSFLRSLAVDVGDPNTAIYALEGLGQVPFEWPDPDGYPDEAEAWAATLAPRWRFASIVLNGWASWCEVDAADLAAVCAGAPPSEWGRCVADALGGTLNERDVDHIQRFVNGSPNAGAAELVAAFELGASSPSFQTY